MSIFDESCSAVALENGVRIEDDPAPPVYRPQVDAAKPEPATPAKMIIVEDAPLIALDLAETMKDLGFDVRATAFTHAQALAAIERWVPDYAVIDLHLGMAEDGRGGEALLSMLEARGCRCLVFSGDDDACRRVAEKFPQVSVLSKPAQPVALAREMERLRRRPPA